MNKAVQNGEKDNFTNNIFSAQEWSAPTLSNPDEIKKRINSFNLEGKLISKMRFVGLSFFHTRLGVEEYAYGELSEYETVERQRLSEYDNIPPDTQFIRAAQIDEPFIIEFEDGDTFEIDTPDTPLFSFSMNCISHSIESDMLPANIDANILFAPGIGKAIKSVEIETYITDKHPLFKDYFDEDHSKRELVSDIKLWLDNGDCIVIGPFIDYCEVNYIDKKGYVSNIPFSELKSALFNWEDLHIDKINGFKPKTSTFFFGKVGKEYADSPFMTLTSGKNKSELYISEDDFLLFGLAIAWVTEEFFDEYENYEFNINQWNSVLNKAETILSFETFDDLFDCLTNTNTGAIRHFMISTLNCRGVELWKNKEEYRVQLNDMQKWAKIVLSDDDFMNVYGF